jgi:hypothetical protein
MNEKPDTKERREDLPEELETKHGIHTQRGSQSTTSALSYQRGQLTSTFRKAPFMVTGHRQLLSSVLQTQLSEEVPDSLCKGQQRLTWLPLKSTAAL